MGDESVKILLAGQNPDDIQLIQELLKDNGFAQAQLTHVERLEEGLQRLDEESFDVLLLDLSLPDSKGLDTLARAKANAPHVLIVVMTDSDKHKELALKVMLQRAGNCLASENLKSDEFGRTIGQKDLFSILDSMDDGLYIVDQQYDIQYVNQVLMKDFGPFAGRKCYEYFHDREDVCPWCKMEEVLAGETVRWEWTSAKNHRTYDLVDTPFRIKDGSQGKLEIFRDITEKKQAEDALRKSEDRYRAVVENSPNGIFLVGEDYKFSYANHALCEILGRSHDEIIDHDFREFLSEDSVRLVDDRYMRRQRGEELAPRYEFNIVKKNSEIRIVNLSSAIVRDIDGSINTVAQIADITDRKRAEEKIQLQVERLKVLRQIDLAISHSQDLSSTLDVWLDQITKRCDIDAASILLFDPDQQVLQRVGSRGFKDEALWQAKLEIGEGYAGQAAENRWTLFIPDLRTEPGDFPNIPLLESEGFISYLCAPMIAKGELKGVIEFFYRSKLESDEEWYEFVEMLATQAAIAIDSATMYKKLKLYNISLEQSVQEATQELRQTKEQVETILNNSPNAIVLLSVDGTVEMINQGFRDLFGYTFVDVRGKPISFLVEEQAVEDCRGILLDVVEHLETKKTEIIASRKDESKLEVEVSLSPVRRNGGLDGIVCTMRDITAWKELQRMKDAFVSNVSHELRTPIAAMRLNHSLLKKDPCETKYLDRFDRDLTRLNQMIDDLLRLSHLDQKQTKLKFKPVDLNSILVYTVKDRAVLAASNELELVFIRQETHIPRAQADANLIDQVLSVLLTNAIHYTPAGGRIEVRVVYEERDGVNWAGFSVQDNGMGISSDDLPYLFERFYRGKAGRESGAPGTGLGLSIASEIVKLHEGRIDVESKGIPGEGTTFTVWLPALTDNSGSEK